MNLNNSYNDDNNICKLFKVSTNNSTQSDDNTIQSSENGISIIPINSIKIKEEYARLVYQLPKSDYDILKESIKENGLYTPIIINPDGIILDGHHRYKACDEIGILDKLRVEIKEFDDPLLENKFIYEINRNRRHLTPFQRIELQYKVESIEDELAKKRMVEYGKLGAEKRWNKGDDNNDDKVVQNYTTLSKETEANAQSDKKEHQKGRVIEVGAKNAQVSPMTYFKGREIIRHASEEDKEKLRIGKTKIEKKYRQLQKQKKREELKNADPVIKLPKGIKLLNGAFEEYSKDIPDNSIDLIFVDPPYDKESFFLYVEQAKLAFRVLKEGGSIVTYVGQHMLPEIHDSMRAAGLKYNHEFAVKLTGGHSMIYPKGIIVEWKPLLWYVKGEKANIVDGPISDFIVSAPPEKIADDWEQSIVEAEHVIKGLTIEDQIVLDPMMGFGTTGIAALKLGRKFIGIEKGVQKFERAKARIGKEAATDQDEAVEAS